MRRPGSSPLGFAPRRLRWAIGLLVLLPAGPGFAAPAVAPASDLQAAAALVARVLPGQEAHFTCELIPAAGKGQDVFEYAAGPGGTIVLRGNSSGSLAVAFNQYLRREARLDYDWLAAGPLHPAQLLPAPAAPVRRACAAGERFFLNYCTYGYTMPWWDWAQWERFLDWMAMNGVNRPLLQAGQEAVWLRVWQAYGLPAGEVRAYFSAPAHLPWHRMANLDAWGGPLPQSYIDGQERLQQLILARARSLGMKAVLPAFSGHVPPALARGRPAARITPIKPGWSGMPPEYATSFLDPQDPLFAEIQGRYLAAQAELYGTDHLYAADPFNEMSPPSWEPAYLAGVAGAIYRGLAAADPDARWYQMTWTFTYEKLQGRWTPERLGAMLHAVPAGRMVLLDYAAEEQEFYSLTGGAYGLPFIWNYLGNFGGNTHLSAPLQKCATLAARALRQPNCIGVGSTLEAMGANPAVYELLLEQPWEEGGAVDLAAWVGRYADRRAGMDAPAVRAAWADLAANVLRDNSRRRGTFGSVFQGLPPLAGWAGRAQNPQQDYEPAALVAALGRLLAATPATPADGYQYDMVNFTRQALCNLGGELQQRMAAALAARDPAGFRRESARFLELGRDLDELLGTRREFLLGPWLAQARRWGADPAEADYYEANAREILTAWHVPGGQLTDYASRQWNGLLRDYYLPRWEKWIALAGESLGRGTPFPEREYLAWVDERCAQWIRTHDSARYAVTPQGDAVATARRLYARYFAAPADGRPAAMLAASLTFADGYWDEAAGLLWSPAAGEEHRSHRVRESAWYALGLLMRDRPGDTARAGRVIDAILQQQFEAPGRPWQGTYRRTPEEPDPPAGGDAKVWEHYDPNWRQFIGTTFALILIDHESRLPEGLAKRMLDSIRRAVEGELTHRRLTPAYTNIALMHGFLWSYAGRRLQRPEWVAAGEEWCGGVHALYVPHESFEEYNSPTYYGVDLYGLALWRRHGATEKIRAWGAEMEAGLWRDIGRFYHAGLGNLCGPFDRAYGMDMRRYVSLTGEWLGLVLPAELTPLPDPSGPMDHAHDFLCVPTFVALGARVPDEVLAGLREFQGERLLRRPIEGSRIATAWLSADVMLGGEITGAARPAGPGTRYNQFHPATMHWRAPGGEVGWARLYSAPACDAEAAKGRLTVTAPVAGDFACQVFAPGLDPARLERDRWVMPGLTVSVETDATGFTVVPVDGRFDIRYTAATHLVLRTAAPQP